jgi:5'-nucleotidase
MLTIAVSSRAIFDITAEHSIFEEQGQAAFDQYQREHEADPLPPGPAFHLIRKLLALNTGTGLNRDRVEVVLISRNSVDAGIRVMRSVEHYKLDIERAAFTKGTERFKYAKAFGAQLFLSSHPDDVRQALEGGLAAATLLPYANQAKSRHEEIRIAFDGDAVLFSDEAERVTQTEGLSAFIASERNLAALPLLAGPFKPLLDALAKLQKENMQEGYEPALKIKIALVTARGTYSYERVLRTLREWGIELDEIVFAAGLSKGPFLEAFGADMFFDDTRKNCDAAQEYVATGHVPHGVMNESKAAA